MNDYEKNNKITNELDKIPMEEKIKPKIICGVTNCMHNCLEDSTCRLNCITINSMKDIPEAFSSDETCCKSYEGYGNLK